MVRSPRLVFGRAGCGVEENHERRSWEGWAHVLPTLAYRACRTCGLDERRNPCQFFGQPGVLAPSAQNPPVLMALSFTRVTAEPSITRKSRRERLRRHLGRSQRVPTRTLRNLESTGLVARRVTESKPIAVEYSVTRPGRTLLTPLRGMCRWAKRNRGQVSAEVRLPQAHQKD